MDTADSPLFAALRDSGRVSAEHLSAAEEAFRACGNDPGKLADQLSALGCVTKYQHRKIQLGRAADLIFGPYLILERIGEGGMGKVYRAIQTRLGRMVAIKTIRPNLLANKVVVSRYKREARAAAALDHPNIVKLFEADDVDGRYYLAMEMVEGMDLSRLVKELAKDKRAIVPAEGAEYIRQAALGLQHAHDKGLVHRDIKPSNLLVSGERAIPGTGGLAAVKILDMGLVRSLSEEDSTQVDLTRDGTVVGTPDYMAPEQAKNSSTVDHRADIYALGCTLFFALRGAPPYSDGTAIDKLIRHQLDPIPDIRQYRPDVPAGLAAVIRRMMSKKADERQQTGGEVARELAPYTEEAVRFDLVSPKFESVEFAPPAEPKSAEVETAAATAAVAATPAPTVTRTVRPISGPTAVQRTVRAVAAPPPSDKMPPPGTRLPQSVRAKPISKPSGDVTPSDSLPGADPPTAPTDTPPAGLRSRRTGRRPTYSPRRREKKDFPLVPVAAVVGVLLAAAFVVAAVLLSRGSNTTPTKSAADPGKPPPAAASAVAFRPMADLISDDTAAVLVADPKQYWKVAQTEVRPLGHIRPNATLLTGAYKFNPWKCDRLVVAFQPNPTRCVAAGEGELLAKPDQFRKDLEQLKRFHVETTKEGVTLVRQGALAQSADKRIRAAVLADPAAYLIGTDGVELADMVRTAGTRDQKNGVDPKLIAGVTAERQARPLLRLVATGRFELPPKKDAGRESLSKHGVELLTLTVRLEAKRFHSELTVSGPDADRLREFVTTFLPGLLVGHVPTGDGKTLAEAVRASAAEAVAAADGGGHRLTAMFVWDWQTAHAAAEKVIPLPNDK